MNNYSKILLIDNYDSFTYNLVHCIAEAGQIERDKIIVKRNNQIDASYVKDLSPQAIFISPGPGTPEETGNCREIIESFYQTIPICGICLGHQLIALVFNSIVNRSSEIIHGKHTQVLNDQSEIYKDLPKKITVGRYHSLYVSAIGNELEVTSQTDSGIIMSIKHKHYPHLIGIQYHPESVLTPDGVTVLKNFLSLKITHPVYVR